MVILIGLKHNFNKHKIRVYLAFYGENDSRMLLLDSTSLTISCITCLDEDMELGCGRRAGSMACCGNGGVYIPDIDIQPLIGNVGLFI